MPTIAQQYGEDVKRRGVEDGSWAKCIRRADVLAQALAYGLENKIEKYGEVHKTKPADSIVRRLFLLDAESRIMYEMFHTALRDFLTGEAEGNNGGEAGSETGE
jgi:hypothetical protein